MNYKHLRHNTLQVLKHSIVAVTAAISFAENFSYFLPLSLCTLYTHVMSQLYIFPHWYKLASCNLYQCRDLLIIFFLYGFLSKFCRHLSFCISILKACGLGLLNRYSDSLRARRSRYRSRSQWPSGLSRGSVAALLLGLRVRIPQWTWIFVLCVVSEDERQNA